MMWEAAGPGLIVVFIAIIITNILFYEWMKAPTHRGQDFLDKIDGFKLFLSVAESEELQYKYAPELYKESKLGWIPKEWEDEPLELFTTQIGDGIHTTPKYSENSVSVVIPGCPTPFS